MRSAIIRFAIAMMIIVPTGYGAIRAYHVAAPWVTGIVHLKQDYDSFRDSVNARLETVTSLIQALKSRYDGLREKTDQLLKFLRITDLTVEQIEGMSDEEFEALLRSLREQQDADWQAVPQRQ